MPYLLLSVLLCVTAMHAEDWTPPEKPDPNTILREAQADAKAQRYATALAKHVWFHHHALSITPALTGVRLSFALSYWRDLADNYPPALERLQQIRDAAERDALEGKDVFRAFQDMRAINSVLGEQARTVAVFRRLADNDNDAAQSVFRLAKPSLIMAKDYILIGAYISPQKDFEKMQQEYRSNLAYAEASRFGERHLKYSAKKFSADVTTLVAVLVVNDRAAEAEVIATQARAQWDDAAFHTALEKALQGNVPAPWP